MAKVHKKYAKKTRPEISDVTIQRTLEAQIFDSVFKYEAQIIACYYESIGLYKELIKSYKEIIGENLMLYPYYPEETPSCERMEFINQELQPIYDKLHPSKMAYKAEYTHYRDIVKSYNLLY